MSTFENIVNISLSQAINFFTLANNKEVRVQSVASFWRKRIEKVGKNNNVLVVNWIAQTQPLFDLVKDNTTKDLLFLLEVISILPNLLTVEEVNQFGLQLNNITEYIELFQDRLISQILIELGKHQNSDLEMTNTIRIFLLRSYFHISPYSKLVVSSLLNRQISQTPINLENAPDQDVEIIKVLETKLLLPYSNTHTQPIVDFLQSCIQSKYLSSLGLEATNFTAFPESDKTHRSYKKLLAKILSNEFIKLDETTLELMIGGIVNSSKDFDSLKKDYKTNIKIFNTVFKRLLELFEISEVDNNSKVLEHLRRAFSSEITNLESSSIKPFYSCLKSYKNQQIVWIDSPRIKFILQSTNTVLFSQTDIVFDAITGEYGSQLWTTEDLFVDDEMVDEWQALQAMQALQAKSSSTVDGITTSQAGKFFYEKGQIVLPKDSSDVERLINRLKKYVAKNTSHIVQDPMLVKVLVSQIQTVIDTYYLSAQASNLDLIQQLCRRLYDQIGRLINSKEMSNFDVTNMSSPCFGFAFPVDVGFVITGQQVNTKLAAKVNNHPRQNQIGEESEIIVSSMFDYLPGHLITFKAPTFSELDMKGLDVFALRQKYPNQILDTHSKIILILFTLTLRNASQSCNNTFTREQVFEAAKTTFLSKFQSNSGMLQMKDIFPEFCNDKYRIQQLNVKPKSSPSNPYTKKLYSFSEFEINTSDASLLDLKDILDNLDFAKFAYLFSKNFQIQGIQVKSSSYNLQQFVSRGLHIGAIYPPFNQSGKLDEQLLSNLVNTMFCY